MNIRKGFTLVELLAVIVILAIVLAIAISGINGIIESSKVSSYNSQMDLIKNAASLYVSQYGDSSTTSVSLNQLISEGLIPSNTRNPTTGQPFDNVVVDVNGAKNVSEYTIYEGPTLVTGMIPIYYDDVAGVWKKADKTNVNNNWYDYNNQKWANAVTVTTATRATYQTAVAGTAISMADINTMFVWIPRYKYLIPAGAGAREISIMFETKYTSKSTGNAVTTYYTHPAFTFGNTELGGIWVGKFETTGTITAPTIQPEALALKSQTAKAMYDSVKTYMQGNTSYGFTNDNDIHMMKNIEWGAVALLTASRYGKYGNATYTGANKELYLNNSSSKYTGRSMGAPGGAGITTTVADGTNLYEYLPIGYYTYDGKCATIHASLPAPCNSGSTGQSLTDKTLSYGASTTGTIYGTYDMSGGSWEYVMGLYEPNPIPVTGVTDESGFSSSTTDSQYNLLTINGKYYNRYLTNTAAMSAILGDTTKETPGWYGDYNNFVTPDKPWFARGGRYSNGAGAGTWAASTDLGGSISYVSFRITIAPQA